MSESDFDATKIALSRITLAAQDGAAQFELLARESLPAILGYDFDGTMTTDDSSRRSSGAPEWLCRDAAEPAIGRTQLIP